MFPLNGSFYPLIPFWNLNFPLTPLFFLLPFVYLIRIFHSVPFLIIDIHQEGQSLTVDGDSIFEYPVHVPDFDSVAGCDFHKAPPSWFYRDIMSETIPNDKATAALLMTKVTRMRRLILQRISIC